MCEIQRKFNTNSLHIYPPHLYTVATLPWEIQKSFFNSIIHTDFRLLRYLRRNKLQLLYCSLSDYLLLFTASYYLRSPILWSVFGQSFSFFKVTANPQAALFGVTNILEERNITCSQIKSFTFHKLVWWHFSGVVGKGVTVFFWDNINNLRYVWIILLKLTFLDFPR